jgi:hypothetical protein
MTDRLFTKDVLLDVSVNIIPLGIILAFFGLFLLVSPWQIELSAIGVVQFLPILIGLTGLTVLTYVGARKIET